MGGLGKTTLATKIFHDSFVEYHFDVRGWVTVSQAYSTQDMLLQLLASIGKSINEAATKLEVAKLCEMLYQSLKGRKYLIIIDDIWSCKAWDDVRQCFPNDNNGSRVLVTTRLTEVASHASQGGFTHNLQHLTQVQSWELLCRKTLRGYECPESLTEPGKRIAKKCGGLPLALVVIAGLLEKEEKRKDLWENIAERVGSYIINDPKGCLDTLALSYDHLPCHLKKCVLYVGGFPEDYKIQVRKLIRLWMAEGFIEEPHERSWEEEAEYYLMDLIDRNLLLVAGKSSNGGVKSCRMHDLLREVCLKKACEENFFKKVSMPTSNGNLDSTSFVSIVTQRRLFLDYTVLEDIYLHEFATHARTVLCFRGSPISSRTDAFWISSFLLLRVLDLGNIALVYKFSDLKILIHLRYLAVWSCNNDAFSFSGLSGGLQTIIVNGNLDDFWSSSNNMTNLRHLQCDHINFNVTFHFTVPTLFNL
ncbi:putative P-loop containing nucleoside triphosphate hydrolase, leucine-rich repeat domain superfamily [Helianthus anomalus]